MFKLEFPRIQFFDHYYWCCTFQMKKKKYSEKKHKKFLNNLEKNCINVNINNNFQMLWHWRLKKKKKITEKNSRTCLFDWETKSGKKYFFYTSLWSRKIIKFVDSVFLPIIDRIVQNVLLLSSHFITHKRLII